MTQKDVIVASLERAHRELDHALAGLADLPSVDINRVRFAAHTLHNYLSVTTATVALLTLHLKANPDAEVTTWLNGLKHATALMTQTALELMNTAPVGGEELTPEKVDLPTLVRRACDFYGAVAERKAIAMEFVGETTAPYVWADRVAVAAVLDNLLSNAVKFSPHGTTVWVRVWAEPHHLVCTIQDEGPGLEPEEQERMFLRGVRLSSVPTGGEPSMGYGLAVAKELADKIGGTIWCDSVPGHGASFSFRLPAYRQP